MAGIKFEESFIENSPTTRAVIRKYIIRHNLIPYICEKCGNDGKWQGTVLALQLDHRNGVNNDHRLENLRWLCPNCHSQTDTFTGKNKTDKKNFFTSPPSFVIIFVCYKTTCNNPLTTFCKKSF